MENRWRECSSKQTDKKNQVIVSDFSDQTAADNYILIQIATDIAKDFYRLLQNATDG